jgi:hypothetical protein
MRPSGRRPIIDGKMDESGIFHRIEDDLSPTWLEEWVQTGVQAIETYLAKHLAFLTYLDDDAAAA